MRHINKKALSLSASSAFYLIGATASLFLGHIGNAQAINCTPVLSNTGTITSTMTDCGTASSTMSNSGQINVTGQGTAGAQVGGNGSTFNNTGTITSQNGTGIASGIWTNNTLTGDNAVIQNNGTITGYFSAIDVNAQNVTIINNAGAILSTTGPGMGWGGGISLYGQSQNTVITNFGTITSPGTIANPSYGITIDPNNPVATLNNAQGAGNTYGALTYYGPLPANYNIIINSTSSYGKLAVTPPFGPLGQTTFGIYSNSSVVANHTYQAVISGVSASNFTSTTGTYSSLGWSLNEQGTSGVWDLLLFTLGPDVGDTQRSLPDLKPVFGLQAALMNNSLNYDCTIFDKNGICVSAGGRYDRVNTGDTHSTNALVIGAYKLNPNTRVGAWVDQNLSVTTGTGIHLSNSQPMFGVFGVWNANPSGHGFEIKLAAGYGNKDLTITRQVIGTSEAGTGTSRLNTQGASAVVAYNLAIDTQLTASPYVGIRYTKLTANAYTEQLSATVTAPLTFNDLKQEAATALLGVKLSGRTSPQVGIFGGLGAELDTSNRGNSYTATGVDGLTPVALNNNIKRLRGTANAGVYYDLDKTQRITFSTTYREESSASMNTLSSMLVYTAGF